MLKKKIEKLIGKILDKAYDAIDNYLYEETRYEEVDRLETQIHRLKEKLEAYENGWEV